MEDTQDNNFKIWSDDPDQGGHYKSYVKYPIRDGNHYHLEIHDWHNFSVGERRDIIYFFFKYAKEGRIGSNYWVVKKQSWSGKPYRVGMLSYGGDDMGGGVTVEEMLEVARKHFDRFD